MIPMTQEEIRAEARGAEKACAHVVDYGVVCTPCVELVLSRVVRRLEDCARVEIERLMVEGWG